MKYMCVCMVKKTYKFFTKVYKESDFPCLADEIAKPRPDMNIKVTAFTESKKFYYISKTFYRTALRLNCLKFISVPKTKF